MHKAIDIIMVCYNCGSDIANVLSELKMGDIPMEAISVHIVDNNSDDDSVETIKEIKGINVNLIQSSENVGFGAGCNRAIPYLTSPKTLLLNPDVHLFKDSICKLLEFAEQTPEARIWGGKTIGENGEDDGKNAWKEPSLLGVICWSLFVDAFLKKMGFSPSGAYSPEELQMFGYVDAVSGCFFLVDTALLKRLHGFDERFFMYSEEVDLCRRARELGAKPMTTDKAIIIHKGSQTISSLNKLRFLYHSKLKYAEKYWPKYQFKLALFSVFLGSVIRTLCFGLISLFRSQKKHDAKVWYEFTKLQLSWDF